MASCHYGGSWYGFTERLVERTLALTSTLRSIATEDGPSLSPRRGRNFGRCGQPRVVCVIQRGIVQISSPGGEDQGEGEPPPNWFVSIGGRNARPHLHPPQYCYGGRAVPVTRALPCARPSAGLRLWRIPFGNSQLPQVPPGEGETLVAADSQWSFA